MACRSRRACKRPAPKSDGAALPEGAALEAAEVADSTADSTTLEADSTALSTAEETSWRLKTGEALTSEAAAKRENAVIFIFDMCGSFGWRSRSKMSESRWRQEREKNHRN